METSKTGLKEYAAAGYPAVAVATADEDRAITRILADFPTRTCLRIAAVGGLLDARTGANADPQATYPAAFRSVTKKKALLLIVLDYQHVIRNAVAYRQLRDALPAIKEQGSMVVLLAPSWTLPPELEHDVPVLSDALPSREELEAALHVAVDASQAGETDAAAAAFRAALSIPALLDAASGLTMAEAENSFALSYAAGDGFSPVRVTEEKLKLIRQSGFLEVTPHAAAGTLGGLGGLKAAITDEILPSIHDRELAVSGAIFCGVPGTGKSHAARVIGGMLGWPVLAASVARMKGSLVGASESNMVALFKLARAVAPAVVMFEELEKGVGGHASSAQSDSGVTLGMVEVILTQMQEIRDAGEPILFVATVNDYAKLPAELTRRFELRFFVDLPTAAEREEIAAIKLARYSAGSIKLAAEVSSMTEDWTGAEIEDLVRAAARLTQRKVTVASLTAAAADIKPIARVRADEIARLRAWGRDNLRLANTTAAVQTTKAPARRVARQTDASIAEGIAAGTVAVSFTDKGGNA